MRTPSEAAVQPGADVWSQILARVAPPLPKESFDTWFRPLVFAGCHQGVVRLMAPNANFKEGFLALHSQRLSAALGETVGSGWQLQIAEPSSSGDPCAVTPLPVLQAAALENTGTPMRWLIEDLWTAQAVGILAGAPKTCKSWLAVEMAVSVASGSPCLGKFPVHASGPVLFFAAEDSLTSLRFRLQSAAQHHQLDFAGLPVHVITAGALRLNEVADQDRLEATVALYRPVLLVLDPLIRIHTLDENVATQMAALLSYFRRLQRQTGLALVLVHHTRKNPSSDRAGYTLRGSSDFYAWLDSFLYLQRRQQHLTLSAEHRGAPGLGPIPLELVSSKTDGTGPFLTAAPRACLSADRASTFPDSLEQPLSVQILQLLSTHPRPCTTENIRSSLRVRKQRVTEVLRCLIRQGKIVHLNDGFSLNNHTRTATSSITAAGSAPNT